MRFWRAVLIVLAVATPFAGDRALACGSMSVTLSLLQKWPAAREPMVAEIRESRTGRLPEPSWQRGRNGDPVSVRQRRAMDVLRALQARVHTTTRPPGTPASFAVLFVDDHVWSRFELEDATTRLHLKGLRPVLPRAEEARVHMSARVVDVMLRGALDYDAAEASGVVLVDGGPAAVAATRRLLEAAFAPPAG